MQRKLVRLIAAGLVFLGLVGSVSAGAPAFATVRLETSEGDIVLDIKGHRSPISVENFLRYVSEGHYDGTIFHRVIPGFVVQGGGYTPDNQERETNPPIFNESGNGLSNTRGSIAMARNDDPHSATSQFYINLADNTRLDPSSRRWGYTVFGEVIEGMDVVDRIAGIPTQAGPLGETMPHRSVMLIRAVLVEDSG
jgi:peptidyl-prolyl cis-trans isomerase A (cyclophilin A)